MKSWEIIADRLSKAGWSLGCVSAVDLEGRTIWIADETKTKNPDTESDDLARRVPYCRNAGAHRAGAAVAALLRGVLFQPVTGW